MPWFSLTMQRVLLCVCAWSREGEQRESLLCELSLFHVHLNCAVIQRRSLTGLLCAITAETQDGNGFATTRADAHTCIHTYTLAPAISQDSNSHNNIVILLWVQTVVWAERKRQWWNVLFAYVHLCVFFLNFVLLFFVALRQSRHSYMFLCFIC